VEEEAEGTKKLRKEVEMENWRAIVERGVTALRKKAVALGTDGIEIAELLDSFEIRAPSWGIPSHSLNVELKDEEELEKFPPQLLGLLLKKVGTFTKSTSEYSGQVIYTGRTKGGITVSLRLGPTICKATQISSKEWVEREDFYYKFTEECDPLFLDEAPEKGS